MQSTDQAPDTTRTFEYEIGGKKYVQKALVLGQIEQLTGILSGLPKGLFNLPSLGNLEEGTAPLKDVLLELLSKGLLRRAIAVVLHPEGVELKKKNLDEVSEDLEWSLEIATGAKVIADFFICNMHSELLSSMKQFNSQMKTMTSPTTETSNQ